MNNSTNLFSYLQTCSLPHAINIINTLNCKVSLLRGRKFYHTGFKGKMTYNALLEVIQAKVKQSSPNVSTEGISLSLKKLHVKGERQLDNSLGFTRMITLAKRLFISIFREDILKDIEQTEIKNKKNAPSSEIKPEIKTQAKNTNLGVNQTSISSKNNPPANVPSSENNVQNKLNATNTPSASQNNQTKYASTSKPSMPQAHDNRSQTFGMPYSTSMGTYYYYVQPINDSNVYGLHTNHQSDLDYDYIYIDMDQVPTPLFTYTPLYTYRPQLSALNSSWQHQGNFSQFDLLFWKLLMECLESNCYNPGTNPQNYRKANFSQNAYSTSSASEKTETENIKENGLKALSSLEEMLDLKGSLTRLATEGKYQALEAELKKAKRQAELRFHPDRRHFTKLTEKEATEQFKKFQQILEDLEAYLKLIRA